MKIGILNETDSVEKRVSVVPESIKLLAKNGHEIFFQSNCGKYAGFPDEEYTNAGAKRIDDDLKKIQLLILLNCPQKDIINDLNKETVVIAQFNSNKNTELIDQLKNNNNTLLAMELVPRIARAQKMDVLSSQASIAGYKAALIAANNLGKYLPMMMTAAGTIPPSKVLVIGAGVAGL
ncbi:MAG: NAD(P)(+) transhydrogenase (Re/Si-specific) subunit alpha, partial [Chloroflexi bacterium]|nr:NAD(P)(+) transhydrogenase (Re/Si-specific) subunit alpha [Chloroflexota bacterium]